MLMNSPPDSPILGFVFGLGCAGLSYICHRMRRALSENRWMPLHARKKGIRRTGIMNLRRTWPFRDEYQITYVRRSLLDAMLFMWKWMLAFVSFMLIAVYPIVYIAHG